MTEQEKAAILQRVVNADGGSGDPHFEMLVLILERQDTLIDRLGRIESDLSGHMQREESAIGRWMDSLPKKPNGEPDVDGHAEFHTAMIEERREKAQMWRELRKTLVTRGVMGLLGVIIFLVGYWWNTSHQ